MTSVKVDATVTGWDDTTPANVDLPSNIIAAITNAVNATPGTYTGTVTTPGGTTVNINTVTTDIATDLTKFFAQLGPSLATINYNGTDYTWNTSKYQDASSNDLVGAGAAIDTDNYETAGSYILTFKVGDTTVTVNITTT